MNDQLNEKLSAFMDGEASDQRVLEGLCQHEEMRSTWTTYHVIRDVMRQHYEAGALQLAAKVEAALKTEPTVLAPKRKPRSRAILRHASGAAIAATIAAMAILVVRQSPEIPQDIPNFAVASANQQPEHLSAAARSELTSYIVSHNEYSAGSRMRGLLPYTRIVSYVQAEGYAQPAAADAKK